MFNRKIGTISWKIHTPYEGMFGKPGYEKEVTGTRYIDLTNAVANKLLELKVYGGTELKPETYLDTVTLSGGCEQRNLPAGHQQLAYLQGDGTAYIQTPVAPTDTTGMKIVFEYGSAGGSGAICGTFEYGGSRKDAFFVSTNSGTVDTSWAFIAQAGSTLLSANSEAPVAGKTYTALINYKNSRTFGFEGFTQQDIGSNGVRSNKVLLFARLNIANNNITASNCKIKYVEFTEGTAVTHIYIPDRFNNTLGLYDKITGAFLTNTNTSGSFTAGPDLVPSPDTPVDIVCNNGVIKVSKNVFDYKYYYDNYQIYQTSSVGRCPIKLKPNTTYTISTNTEVNTASARVFAVVGNAINWTPNTANNGVLIDAPRTLATDSSGYLCVGIYYKGEGTIPESDFDNGTVWVQIEEGSSATSYTPYSPTVIYTEGTQEVVTDSLGNTANAEMLLKIGNYTDTQEVLNGAITRNIGIMVLKGTENWSYSSSYSGADTTCCYLPRDEAIKGQTQTSVECYCSHFNWTSRDAMSSDTSTLCGAVTGAHDVMGTLGKTITLRCQNSIAQSAAGFKTWLAEQYANGTPVIVVYPLATATTSTVTGQFLSKSPVTQTAGSISNLPIAITESEKTTPTPQYPLPIICNDGELKVDSQGNVYTNGTLETVEIIGNNLLDLNAVTDGYYYDAQGNYTSLSSARLTDYIPIEVGKDVKVYFKSLATVGNLNVRINIFNSNKVWQSQEVLTLEPSAGGTKIITPTYNGYIRVSGNYSTTQRVDWDTASVTEVLSTATAKMLLKVGSYADEQEILSGDITRKVGILVLNGTENWTSESVGGQIRFYTIISDMVRPTQVRATTLICTQFQCVDDGRAVASVPMNSIYCGSGSNYIYIKTDVANDTTGWKQYLATQYQNGTPVIVVYPLATSTTETVAGQPMTIQKGNNRIEITQASMDDLELSAKYKSSQQ